MAVCLVLLAASCAEGSGGDAVEFEAELNGIALAASDPDSPIELDGEDTAQLELTMRNVTDEPLTVRYVKFEGEVIDMIFLTYDTALRVDLEPGVTTTIPPLLLDFYDLGGQASGYLRGHVQLYDGDRELLGSEQMFLDARGDGLSTLALFNILLLLATVIGAAWNLMRLAQRRLPANRLARAMRFLAIGVGVGLTLAVAFSTLRIWPLPTLTWVLFTVIGAIVGFVIGYLLPGADDEVLEEEEEIVIIEDEGDLGSDADNRATIDPATRTTTLMKKGR